MAMMKYDAEDTVLIGLVALSAAVMAQLATFSAFGMSLSDTISLGGATLSYAYIGTVGAFLVTVYTNDMELDPREFSNNAQKELDDYYYYLLMGSLILLVAWPFFGQISTFVTSADVWGIAFVAASVGAQIAIGYMR